MVWLEERQQILTLPISESNLDESISYPTDLYSDEPTLETDLHRRQIDLLIRLLEYWWHDRNDFYISGNLTVYYSAEQTKKRDFRGPDLFIVLNTDKKDRRSWVVWEEGGMYPNVVIELLSDSTEQTDRTTKKDLYQNVWRLPEYYWFDPETMEFVGFRLRNGRYEAITQDDRGLLMSEELGLGLGIHDRQLRWHTKEGVLIPLPEVAAQQQAEHERQAKEQAQQQAEHERQAKEQAQQQAEHERQAKEQAQQRAEKLDAYLRSRGIDPDYPPE